MIGIRIEIMAKHHFSYEYGGHLENVSYIQLLFIIGFRGPENIGVDNKIVFLNGLEAKILPKTQLFNDCLVAILLCPVTKFLNDAKLASA